jgi:hypothetical protein
MADHCFGERQVLRKFALKKIFQEADQFLRKISLFKVQGKQVQSGHGEQALL